MELVVPIGIVLFGLVMLVFLHKGYSRWGRRVTEIERSNAEVVERVRRKREQQ